jgi:hypothetical protein
MWAFLIYCTMAFFFFKNLDFGNKTPGCVAMGRGGKCLWRLRLARSGARDGIRIL